MMGNNLKAHLDALEKQMRDAAANLDFEKAARLRDEIKRLKAAELAIMDDPMAREEAKAMEGIKRNAKATRESLLPGREKVPGRADEGATPSYLSPNPPSTTWAPAPTPQPARTFRRTPRRNDRRPHGEACHRQAAGKAGRRKSTKRFSPCWKASRSRRSPRRPAPVRGEDRRREL